VYDNQFKVSYRVPDGKTSNAIDMVRTAGGSWQTADATDGQCQRLLCSISSCTVELWIAGTDEQLCRVCTALYRMCCLNCALTGSKKPKLSSKLSSRKQADDDDDDDDYDDDDDDYDEADVPLPDVRVKPTTQQFYEQNKEKVAISSCVLLFLHTSSYQHTFCHITTDIWLIKCCF